MEFIAGLVVGGVLVALVGLMRAPKRLTFNLNTTTGLARYCFYKSQGWHLVGVGGYFSTLQAPTK